MASGSQVDLVALIPAGPGTRLDYLLDTIESVRFWTGPCRAIVVIDDSGAGRFAALGGRAPDLAVVPTPRVMGKFWGMHAALSMAYRYALDHYEFPVLLRLDDDALVIGPRPEVDAARFFAEHPDAAFASAHDFDSDGRAQTREYPRRVLLREMHWTSFLRTPRRARLYRRLVGAAVAHGYKLGEFCFGGACFASYRALRRLRDADMLPVNELAGTRLEEDHIFALLAMSLGMQLGDFAGDGDPMGVSWLTLPMSPQELLDRRRKVIHSVRGWADMNQDMIRTFFRAHRQRAAAAGQYPAAGAEARALA
jgi:hypothetical protein